jgi:hypothetical protein
VFSLQRSGIQCGQDHPSSYETTLKNFVGIAKNSEFVMPDLIRHPEFAEVTGFRPSPE